MSMRAKMQQRLRYLQGQQAEGEHVDEHHLEAVRMAAQLDLTSVDFAAQERTATGPKRHDARGRKPDPALDAIPAEPCDHHGHYARGMCTRCYRRWLRKAQTARRRQRLDAS